MIDIETMSTERPHATILTVATCNFDINGHDTYESIINDPNRYKVIHFSAKSNQDAGRHICADTVLWWLRQSTEAQEALLDRAQANLNAGLTDLITFITNSKPKLRRFWAKSPDFDHNILEHAIHQQNLIVPWRYHQTRCVRTICDLAWGEDVPAIDGGSAAHDALNDVIAQIMLVQTAHHILKS